MDGQTAIFHGDNGEPDEGWEQPEDGTFCPVCGGQGALLGQLGNLTWLRCIQCGMDFSSGIPHEA